MPLPMFPKPGPAAPASPPTGNPGEMATAMAQVRQALQILEMALPKLEPGSKQHQSCVDAVSKLSKSFPATDELPGIQNTTLMDMARQAKQGAMMRQLMASGGGGGAPPAPAGGGGPPMPMGGGDAAPAM